MQKASRQFLPKESFKKEELAFVCRQHLQKSPVIKYLIPDLPPTQTCPPPPPASVFAD